MKLSILTTAYFLAMALSSNVGAQVYESEDAQGNPVFTDSPVTGAKKVEIPQENIADAVKVPPESHAAEAAANIPSATGGNEHRDVVVIPNSNNDEIERDFDADMPHEVLDAEERHEVGDTPSAGELKRREEARTGEYIDEEGNTVRVEHRGHAGGRR